MSKKRLDRTVIEGGRGRGNKNDRYQSNAEVRQSERDFLKAVTIDPLLADEEDIDTRTKISKEFRDKLNPMHKWLASKVDQPWSDVRAEVFAKFDTRTIAGSHITFDHLLSEVIETISGFDDRGYMYNPNIVMEKKTDTKSFYNPKYYVDENDILRKTTGERYKWWKDNFYPTIEDWKVAEKFLDGRMVKDKGGVLFWVLSTKDVWRCSWFEPPFFSENDGGFNHQRKLQYFVGKLGNYKYKTSRTYPGFSKTTITTEHKTSGSYWDLVPNPYSYKQRGQLSAEDAKTFRAFKGKIKQDILAYSKGR